VGSVIKKRRKKMRKHKKKKLLKRGPRFARAAAPGLRRACRFDSARLRLAALADSTPLACRARAEVESRRFRVCASGRN
jgi:hypothetical protein